MPERWETEIRKLRSLSPPESLPRPLHEPGVLGPSTHQRVLALVVALAVFGGGGAFVWEAFSSSPQPAAHVPVDEGPLPPNVARVRCLGQRTSVSSPEVRPQQDGVHLVMSRGHPGGTDVFVRLSDPRQSVGLRRTESYHLRSRRKEVTLLIGPGTLAIWCSPPGGGTFEALHVADPLGVWGPSRLACPSHDRQRFDVHGYEGYPHVSSPIEVRENLGGLRPTDDVRWAGYPDAKWIWKAGPWLVVVRNSESIASIWFSQVDGAATVYACPGSGISPPGHPWNES